MALLKVLPEVIRESAKPMEPIDSIKIVQVDELTNNGGSGGGSNGSGGGSGNLASDAASAALAYRAQAPVLDGLMQELGLDGSSLNSLVKGPAESIGSASDAPTDGGASKKPRRSLKPSRPRYRGSNRASLQI
jgi:hypothetical protein